MSAHIPLLARMVSRNSTHRDSRGVGSSRPGDSIIIPSDSESDVDERQVEKTVAATKSDRFRTTPKRKAVSELNPFAQIGKRARVSQPAAHDVPDEATSQKPARDARFWYPDGNVVIKAGDTYFKLFRSRLSQQCRYFERLLSPPAQSHPQPSSSTDASARTTGAGGSAPLKELDGCAVYEVSGIDVSDFTIFLNFLEYPLEHSVSTAPSDKLYALLRASDVLGCDLVHGLAKKAVADQWPSYQPSKEDAASWMHLGSRTRVEDAIQAIAHTRRYGIRGVLRRALYELLRNSAFWDAVRRTHTRLGDIAPAERLAVVADRDLLAPLARDDLVSLQHARWELREAWDALMRIPPGCDKGWKRKTCGVCPLVPHGQAKDRAGAWAVERAHPHALLEFCDPIVGTYRVEEWLDGLKRHSRGKWCEGCLDERKYMWGEARTTWWQRLDEWLQIGGGILAVGLHVETGREHTSGSSKRRLLI